MCSSFLESRAGWLLRGILAHISRGINTYSSEAVSKIEMEGKLPNSFYEASITFTENQTKILPKRRIIDQYP